MQEWPLLSHVELRALPGSVRSARLHTTSILHRWGLGGLADTAELLVSEIITNAVRASTPIVRQQRETEQAPGAQLLRFWLTSDQRSVLIQVWDSNHHGPVRKYVGSDAEAGRGLLLIETLSAQWGWYAPDGQGGKIVWAVCAYLIQTRHLERSRASPRPAGLPRAPGVPGRAASAGPHWGARWRARNASEGGSCAVKNELSWQPLEKLTSGGTPPVRLGSARASACTPG